MILQLLKEMLDLAYFMKKNFILVARSKSNIEIIFITIKCTKFQTDM